MNVQDRIEIRTNADKTEMIFMLELCEWRECWEISKFISEHETLFLGYEQKAVLLTILNELIENAFKYSFEDKRSITLKIERYSNRIIVEAINKSDIEQAEVFKVFLNEMNKISFKKILLKYLRCSVFSEKDFSRLGLLTLLKDYECFLDFKIIAKEAAFCDVVVKAGLSV